MAIRITENFIVRAATLDDIPAVVDLANAAAMRITGEPAKTPDMLRGVWDRPGFNMATDTWLVHTPEGQLVGYAGFADRAPHVNSWAWAFVHPDHLHQGIGSLLIRLTDERAREIVPLAPANARVTLRRSLTAQDTEARRLLLRHDYRSVRHSWRMRIDLGEQPPAPIWPDGVRLRVVDPDREARLVIRTLTECFRDHWGFVEEPEEEGTARLQHHMQTSPDFDPSLFFLAVHESSESIAGVILCDPAMSSDPHMGYVGALGVKRAWRRQGLGLAMLHQVFGEFYRRGTPRVALHVDAQNLTGATRLYEKAGMHVDQQYEHFEIELRPGDDLTTQTVEA